LADPSKFKAMPRLPGYSKKYRTFVVGRNGYKVLPHATRRTAHEQFVFDVEQKPQTACSCTTQCFQTEADPSKFKAMPRLPGYSKKYRTFVVGRNGYKVVEGNLILTDKKTLSRSRRRHAPVQLSVSRPNGLIQAGTVEPRLLGKNFLTLM